MPLVPMHSLNQSRSVAKPDHYNYCTHTAAQLISSQGLGGATVPKAPPSNIHAKIY